MCAQLAESDGQLQTHVSMSKISPTSHVLLSDWPKYIMSNEVQLSLNTGLNFVPHRSQQAHGSVGK